jgi:prepilin-type N-terminal cleavage/methylation domain-containing protein
MTPRMTPRMTASDRGFTLIETLVAMAVTLLIGTMVSSLVVYTQRQTTAQYTRLADVDQARVGLDALTRVIRTAVQPAQLQTGCTSCLGEASTSTALTYAKTDSIQLFSNIGDPTGPFLVTFLAATDSAGTALLTERIQRPDLGSAPNFTYTACTPGTAGCGITTRTLVRGMTWPLTAPIFTYRNNAASAFSLASGGQLTADQLLAVDSIDVQLPVKTPNKVGAGPMSASTRISLPNASSAVLATAVPFTE